MSTQSRKHLIQHIHPGIERARDTVAQTIVATYMTIGTTIGEGGEIDKHTTCFLDNGTCDGIPSFQFSPSKRQSFQFVVRQWFGERSVGGVTMRVADPRRAINDEDVRRRTSDIRHGLDQAGDKRVVVFVDGRAVEDKDGIGFEDVAGDKGPGHNRPRWRPIVVVMSTVVGKDVVAKIS